MIGTHAYDVLDRRIAKTVDGTITAYIYDMSSGDPLAHDDILLEFDATAAPAILTRRWAHSDSVDEPLGFEAYSASGGAGTGSERAVFADRQGSVVWVTDPATGDVVAAYEYDGFGQLTQTQGTLVQPYGYTGREYDAESGLYYYRARNYDPASGVFLQSDPIGFESGQLSEYGYVNNSPFSANDSTGMSASFEFSHIGPSNSANGLATSTYVSVGAISAAGGISSAISSMSFGDFGVRLIKGKFKPTGTGYCSPTRHATLQSVVNSLKGGAGCIAVPKELLANPAMSTRFRMVNLSRMHRFSRLAIARATINAACYGGGDLGHNIAIEQALIAMEKCRNYITYNTAKVPKR